MGTPATAGEEPIEVAGVGSPGPIDVGNPHAVVFVDDPADVRGGRARACAWGPTRSSLNGANIGVCGAAGRQPHRTAGMGAWVWRDPGVRDGGAAAAAAVAHRLGRVGSKTTVRLPGGDLLVTLDERGAWLTGPANYVFDGDWYDPT